jgi:predicted unusual protein kinase regulating ubiquinone biosynthesis (AarF/ABC1/UbiB family)
LGKRRTAQRFIKLAGLSAQVAGKMASHRVRGLFSKDEQRSEDREQLMQDVGRELTRTLGEMKGAVMKVGQIASQMKDLFPEEIARELEALQKQAPPMPFSVIAAQIEQALGEPPDAIFANIEQVPFAAASIGQVHRAVLSSGERVVVKVQYPDVGDSCESDLKHLKALFNLAGLFKLDERMLEELFDEIRNSLLVELDYEAEARNLLLFKKYYESDDTVLIPKLYPRYSAKTILTLSEEQGHSLQEIDQLGLSDTEINTIGKRLFQFVCEQLFDLRALHADPHPGNFAIRSDGKIILYDFGAVKSISEKVSEDLKALTRAVFLRDGRDIDRVLRERGVRRSGTDDLPPDFYDHFVSLVLPIFDPEEDFDFGQSKLHEELLASATGRLKEGLHYFQATRESVHIDRVFSGHYWNLVQLGVKTSLRAVLARYTELP